MKRAATCSICGLPALRGARLCGPCRAALKRAAQHTVQDLPQYRAAPRPAQAPRHARRDPAADGGPIERHARRSGAEVARRAVLAGAAVAALAGVAWLGRPQWMTPEAAPGAHPAPARAAEPRAVVPPPLPAIALSPAMPVAALVLPPNPKPARARAPASAAPARVAVAPPPETPTAYPSLDAFGAVAEAPRAAAGPSRPEPAPPPDRWQQMSDALAQCDHEGGLSGFLCDQRVRIDACEGWWGRVPQCPPMPENPR